MNARTKLVIALGGAVLLSSPCVAQGGLQLLYRAGLPVAVPGMPGFAYAQVPDGSKVMKKLEIGLGQVLYQRGVPIPVPESPGFVYCKMPDGSVGMMPLPGTQ